MKSVLFSLGFFAVLTSSYASAAPAINAQKIWKNGSAVIKTAIAEKKMQNILNPIVCALPTTGEIALIYSVDFRYQDAAYLNIPKEGIQKIDGRVLGIEYLGKSKTIGALVQTQIKLPAAGNVEMTCVTQTMVLE